MDNAVAHHASATTTVDQFPPQDGWLDDCRFVLGPRYFSNESYAAGKTTIIGILCDYSHYVCRFYELTTESEEVALSHDAQISRV